MPTQEIPPPRQFDDWIAALEHRHLADLRFSEVTPALRALSSGYVERRETLTRKRTLDGAGKRAAFALFYGPLHFLLVHHVVHALGAVRTLRHVVDLGCGTGAAGAAWAAALNPPAAVTGFDEHPWTLGEAAFTYRSFNLQFDTRRADAARARIPARGAAEAVVAAFLVNELAGPARQALLEQLIAVRASGAAVLIVEPIAKSISPWWPEWSRAFAAEDGRADEWSVPVRLPPLVKRLATAAGLRQDVLKARTLYAAPAGLEGTPELQPGPERAD